MVEMNQWLIMVNNNTSEMKDNINIRRTTKIGQQYELIAMDEKAVYDHWTNDETNGCAMKERPVEGQ